MLNKKKASNLDLKNALRKNLRKRKLFQKKIKKINDTKRQAN
tara:strand:- start:1170 stop:1295 length:126 start_codon:yes stop_codon:yes gene_type:complete